MDSQKSKIFLKILFMLLSFLLLFLLAEDLGKNFFLPEGASITAGVLNERLASPAERLFTKPLLPTLAAWLSPCRSSRTLWPFVCALGGTLLGVALLYALRFSGHSLLSLFSLLPVIFSVPLLFAITSAPAEALGLAFFTVATTDLLEHLRTGRTYPLFSAGIALGVIPFGISWGIFLVLGFFLGNRLLVEVEEHGFLAEYVVLFTPFLLFAGGWWFLHWVYRQGGALFPFLSFPLREMARFSLSGGLLFCGILGVLLCFRCEENRRNCIVSLRFFLLVFLGLGIAWIFSPLAEARLRLTLLSVGIILLFLGFLLLPLRNRLLGFFFLVLFCVGTWMELPGASENLGLWKRALGGEDVLSFLYPEEQRVKTFLEKHLSGSVVGIEGRSFVIEHLAGDVISFVSIYDFSPPRYVLRPFFSSPGEDEKILIQSPHWLLLRKKE